MPTAIIKQPKPIIFFTYTESRHSILVVVYDKKAKSIIYCWNNTGIKVWMNHPGKPYQRLRHH